MMKANLSNKVNIININNNKLKFNKIILTKVKFIMTMIIIKQ